MCAMRVQSKHHAQAMVLHALLVNPSFKLNSNAKHVLVATDLIPTKYAKPPPVTLAILETLSAFATGKALMVTTQMLRPIVPTFTCASII